MTNPSQHLKLPAHPNISPTEYQLIQQLRERNPAQQPMHSPPSLGDRISDRVVQVVGSWNFIVTQSILLAIWIVVNVVGTIARWDPYPFILLNLMLSFQAAYTAPIIMMSQNRQSQLDREDARHDYDVNLKAELEIEFLHDKMNVLREEEMVELLMLVKSQQNALAALDIIQTQQARIEDQLQALLQRE